MDSESPTNRFALTPSIATRVAVAMMLLFAPLSWPYGYYQLLRLVVVAVCGWHAFIAYSDKKTAWLVTFGAMALLFNPFVPAHLTRALWLPINLVSAALLGLSVASWSGQARN